MSTPRPLPLACALAAVLCAIVTDAHAAGRKRTYRDPVHKFSLQVPADWNQLPVEPFDFYTVAKFYDPVGKGDMIMPHLLVMRLHKDPKAESPLTGLDRGRFTKEQFERIEAEFEKNKPKSVFDVALKDFGKDGKGQPPDPERSKPFRSRERVTGRMWVHEAAAGRRTATETPCGLLVTFEQGLVEYGVFLVCTANRRSDLERELREIARSFKFHDERAKDVESIDVLDDVNLSPRKRMKLERGLVKGWELIVSPKKNYVIVYNTKKGKNHELARTLAERIEAIREQLYEVQFPPAQPIEAVSVVRVCADAREYRAYGGMPGSAGYWNSATEELVFYDAQPKKKVDDDTLAVLYHEAFHQYIFYSVGAVAPHSWFNEGHGDYYAGARYDGRRFRVEPFDWRFDVVKAAIRQGPREFVLEGDPQQGQQTRKFVGKQGYTPLVDLVAFSQRDYYSYPGVSYAQGWSVVYFLREIVPKKRRYAERWGHILPTYFDVLQREVAKTHELKPGGDGDGDEDGDEPDPEAPDPADPDLPADPDAPVDPDAPDEDGDGGEGDEAEEDEDAPPMSEIPPEQEGYSTEEALKTALAEAFRGVDMDELEKAWIDEILKLKRGG